MCRGSVIYKKIIIKKINKFKIIIKREILAIIMKKKNRFWILKIDRIIIKIHQIMETNKNRKILKNKVVCSKL